MVTIQAELASKIYKIRFDLKSKQRIFETQMEMLNRDARFKKTKPIRLVDYTKGSKENSRVDQFVKDMHQ